MSTPTEAPPDDAAKAPATAADAEATEASERTAAPVPAGAQAGSPEVTTARPDPPPLDRLSTRDRRRLRRAWALATLPIFVAYTWVITAGTWDLLQRQYFDNFFDVQARSLFHGRWDVPPDVVGFEGFLIDGKTYVYFGPFPAVLRMPALLVTDRLDGRLTTLSMMLALLVLSTGAFRLACALRPFVRGADPVGRREPLALAGLAVAILAGPPFFLASGAVVYHEATAWGLAFAMLAFDAVLRFALRPTGWRLVGASALVTLTLLSRQSVGLAPLVTLALVCLWFLWRHARAGSGPWRRRVDLQAVVVLGAAGLVPLLLVGAINYAKFESPFIPPSSAHVESMKYGPRQEMLADNDGSLFGLQFAPTTLRQYARPDGIDVRRDFPWIDFPRLGPKVVGDTNFDELDWSSSIPTAAAALTVLSIVAAVWAVRHRKERRGGPPWIAALCIGAACGAFGVVSLGYIANRYLNDLLPVVLIPGIVGFHVVVGAAVGWRRVRRALVTAGVGLLVVFTALINVVLALSYQREKGPVIPEEWRAEWVNLRLDMPGAYSPYMVDEVWRFMPRHKDVFDGRLAVVGDCAGMYLERNDKWEGIERGPGVDVYDVVVDLDDLPEDGSRVPLMTTGRANNSSVIAMVRVDEDTVRVDVSRSRRAGSAWRQGTPVELDGEVTIRIDGDQREPPYTVSYGRAVLNGAGFHNDDRRDLLGKAPGGLGVARRFPGELRIEAPDMSGCRKAIELVEYNKAGFQIVE
jgi:hypothetical protein